MQASSLPLSGGGRNTAIQNGVLSGPVVHSTRCVGGGDVQVIARTQMTRESIVLEFETPSRR